MVNCGRSLKSNPAIRKPYFMKDYRYNSQDQFIISPTLYRTINTLVKTGVL